MCTVNVAFVFCVLYVYRFTLWLFILGVAFVLRFRHHLQFAFVLRSHPLPRSYFAFSSSTCLSFSLFISYLTCFTLSSSVWLLLLPFYILSSFCFVFSLSACLLFRFYTLPGSCSVFSSSIGSLFCITSSSCPLLSLTSSLPHPRSRHLCSSSSSCFPSSFLSCRFSFLCLPEPLIYLSARIVSDSQSGSQK